MTQNAASPVFRPIYIIWTLFGLNTHVSKSDPYYLLKKVILSIKWIIISCFLFYTYVGAFLSLKELNLEFKLDDKNLFQYNYLSFIVFNMVTWVCMFYFNRKFPKFVEMLNLINPYPPELWRKEKLKRMSKFITYGTYLSLVFPSMFFGISTSGLIYFPYQYFPTYYPSWVNYSFIIHSILNGHIFCTSVVSMLIIINILKCFNEKVKTVLDNVVDDTSAVKTVDDLFQCHCDFVAITKIVDELNSTFSHLITISHVYFFGGICVTSFIFTKGSLSLGVLLTFSILSIMWLVIFLCMWYLSSCVYDQVGEYLFTVRYTDIKKVLLLSFRFIVSGSNVESNTDQFICYKQ